MRIRKHVDLNDHLNRNVANGNPADFRVSLRPVFHSDGAGQTGLSAGEPLSGRIPASPSQLSLTSMS